MKHETRQTHTRCCILCLHPKRDLRAAGKAKNLAYCASFTHISTFELMDKGIMKGYFNWGMNPCHSAPNASFVRRSMAKLDWLVVADQVETESACFWKAPDMNPAEIQTEVYYLPCALIYE